MSKAQFDALAAQINADLDALSPPSGGSQQFTMPSGHVITIDQDGLSLITKDGLTVGQGPIRVQKAYYTSGQPFKPTFTSKSVSFPESNVAVVTHAFSGILNGKSVMRYEVSDVITITADVYNFDSTTRDVTAINITPLKGSQVTYPPFDKFNDPYPSYNTPIGAFYFTGPVNGAAYPVQNHNARFALHGRDGGFPIGGFITFAMFFFRPIGPNGKETFKFVFSLSNNTNFDSLLAGYKTHLNQSIAMQYVPDVRPLAQFASIDPSYIRPDNPYGYNDNGNPVTSLWRRFDLPGGGQAFVNKLLPGMQACNYQGVILWQPQGIHPRGIQYRPDFNVFPPETLPNMQTMAAGFAAAGKTTGLLSRPSVTVTTGTWTADDLAGTAITETGDSPAFLKRFQWAATNLFNGFYLDSVMSVATDQPILEFIRRTVGPNVQLWAEFSTAASLAWCGSYGSYRGEPLDTFNTSTKAKILFWLYPQAAKLLLVAGNPPSGGGFSALMDWMFANHYTPMLQDYTVSQQSYIDVLAPLVAAHIDANHQWIN